jgi:hypothetical protein
MMRNWPFLFLASFAIGPAVGAYPKPEQTDGSKYEEVVEALIRNPPYITAARVPAHYRLGRCLLEVDGRKLISGPCTYQISKDGSFEFHGPRQVFAGLDYPEPKVFAYHISTDYFVQVDRELNDDGSVGHGWTANWNEDKRGTHAQSPFGPVQRKGACYATAKAYYTGSNVKICLWKS